PAGPTNGSPQRFSLAPGASATITHRAGVRPTNGTGVLTQGVDDSSQRVQVRIWLRTAGRRRVMATFCAVVGGSRMTEWSTSTTTPGKVVVTLAAAPGKVVVALTPPPPPAPARASPPVPARGTRRSVR